MANPKLVRALKTRLAEIREAHFEPTAPDNRFRALVDDGALDELIEKIGSKDPAVRTDALRAIGMVHAKGDATDASLRACIDFAKSKNELDEEMRSALFAIGKSRHPELVHGYCAVLGAEAPLAVAAACTVLGYAQWKQAVEYLKFVVNEDYEQTATMAIWALGQIGSEDALPTLHHALINGKHPRWIPGALADIGHPSSLELLGSMLKDPHPDIRFFAVMAIRTILEKQPPDFKAEADWLVPELKAVSNADSYAPTAISALVALARLGVTLKEDHVRRVVGLESKALFTGREAFYLSRGN